MLSLFQRKKKNKTINRMNLTTRESIDSLIWACNQEGKTRVQETSLCTEVGLVSSPVIQERLNGKYLNPKVFEFTWVWRTQEM